MTPRPATTPARKKTSVGRTRRTDKKEAADVAELTHSDADKARALVAYRTQRTVKHACVAAGIARSTWYEWRQSDAAFDRLARDAEDDVADELEAKAIERATAPVDPSDTLLIFLLKSLRRERFGDRQTVTIVHPDVQDRLRRQAAVIASKQEWATDDLFAALQVVWQ